jgi:hypothetical protein
MTAMWPLQPVGTRRRTVPDHALVHASVASRVAVHPAYRRRLPRGWIDVDQDWKAVHPLPADRGAAVR